MSLLLVAAAGAVGFSLGYFLAVTCTAREPPAREPHVLGTCPAASLPPSSRPGPHLCGPLCEEWLRIEEVASLARHGHVDRAGAASQLETYAWHAQALADTAQTRAAELRRRARN